MTANETTEISVIGGIDTHTDFHQAAVIDTVSRQLATESFETTPDGYWRLLEWFASHGEIIAVGMEGTGSYGAELARFMRGNELTVIEVDRPDRKARRANGKSDPVDAYAAATAVLSGRADGTPKTRDGIVESIRVLRVARMRRFQLCLSFPTVTFLLSIPVAFVSLSGAKYSWAAVFVLTTLAIRWATHPVGDSGREQSPGGARR
ncbi:transposase [Streptomyces sp. NPDC056660]|uniref:IS110 family transposase n=1 Tax=Streptomyces sp. NPDC056660 TaxID=3345897 RepID=UPI0036D13EBA